MRSIIKLPIVSFGNTCSSVSRERSYRNSTIGKLQTTSAPRCQLGLFLNAQYRTLTRRSISPWVGKEVSFPLRRQLISPYFAHLDQGQRRTFAVTHRVWDEEAVEDLFNQYAQERNGVRSLNCDNIRSLLRGIGEIPADETVSKLFAVADADNNGLIDYDEFLEHANMFLADNPARIIIVLGGPGSGKGRLSKRLTEECNVVHLSSGDMLRQEVALGTKLGEMVQGIMSRGELVSSAIMVALMKKRMKDHPGKRVLLDGFPRSIENAHDLFALCGKPELALHLECDDTILMERIMERGATSSDGPLQVRRDDDNFQAALRRIRTFHSYHYKTLDWLREHHVPIVNLDCSGSPESVWQQLVAIGKLMRPAVKLKAKGKDDETPNPLSFVG
jgi:adenylate kinase